MSQATMMRSVVASGRQRRVETAQAARCREHDRRHDERRATSSCGTSADQQDIVGQLTQFIQLTLENPSAADTQRAFVAAAEAARLPAGENRGTGHRPVILPPA